MDEKGKLKEIILINHELRNDDYHSTHKFNLHGEQDVVVLAVREEEPKQ